MDRDTEELLSLEGALRKEMGEEYAKLSELRKLLNAQTMVYLEAKEKYEKVDRQLAMVDGRFKKVPATASGKRKHTLPNITELSKDQLLRIAAAIEERMKGGEDNDSESSQTISA